MIPIEKYDFEQKQQFVNWSEKPRHKGLIFNEDGIINPNVWYNQNKKVLFVLKEAYHEQVQNENGCQPYNLAKELSTKGPWNSIWNRVAEWSYGIHNTTYENIALYNYNLGEENSKTIMNEYLNRIAIINIKKSGGRSKSESKDLDIYAKEDAEELRKQIFDIILPNIIVCGYTFEQFNSILEIPIDKKNNHNDNWFYFVGDMIIIDFYHPANQYPALLNYYGLSCIYQQALIKQKEMNL